MQYPPRACCERCLSGRLGWEEADAVAGTLLARTVLHHSQEARFRAMLPLGVGLVRLEGGPVAVCFVPDALPIGARVTVRAGVDEGGGAVLTVRS